MEFNQIDDEIITLEFLQNALDKKIEKFEISSGSKTGDNYSSTMYSIEVHFSTDLEGADLNTQEKKSLDDSNLKKTDGDRVFHLISKCYPNSPSRQDQLIQMNFFHKELSFYKYFIPKLIKMQDDLKPEEIIQPTFPPLVAGYAINFDEEIVEEGKVYKPFDNYIMMVDLRKTFGFRLADRLKSLDRAHVSLIMNAMAKNHALSWIYKQKHNISDIKTKFPFIMTDFSIKYFENVFTDMLIKNGNLIYEIVKSELGESSPVVKGTRKLVDMAVEMINISYGVDHNHLEYAKFLRIIPNQDDENLFHDVPWRVVLQGDCWTNNMLFRYNDVSGEPEDVILVDLQLIREGCPTTDLAHMIYTSTDLEFRRNHLEEMLDLYAEKFLDYCQILKTEPPPGFSVQELKRRFHLSKPFGFCFGLLGLPIFLIENEIREEYVEQVDEGKTIVDMMTDLMSSVRNEKDSILKQRAIGLCQGMFEDGVI